MLMRFTSKLALTGTLTIGLVAFVAGQEAGSRDLTTSWRAPDDHVPSPPSATCPAVNRTISNGDKTQHPPRAQQEKLELTITEISPPRLRVGADFIAHVRLKNAGTAKVLIPWQPDGEQVAHVSSDGTEEKYEVADVTFRLAGSGKKAIAIPLQSEGALFAQPDDLAAYIQVNPGRWVDIKLRGTVACGLEDCRSEVRADEHSVLTAWWYQRVLTHRVKACDEDHGVTKVREIDSASFPVVVRPAAVPSKGATANLPLAHAAVSVVAPYPSFAP